VPPEETYVFDPDKPWGEEPPTRLPPLHDADFSFGPTSWSPDGERLAGFRGRPDCDCGIVIYSFDSSSYQQLTEIGWWPIWLKDGRRLMFVNEDETAIQLLDTETEETQEVLSNESISIAPDRILRWPALSQDNRSIYIDRLHTEADIWMLTLGGQE
jgi:hypothetical protein